jgi:type 1 glutamine amidotransferase
MRMCFPYATALLAAILLPALSHTAELKDPTAEELEKIAVAAPAAPTVKPKAPRKILVCSLVPTGYVHSSIPYGQAALQAIAEKTGAFEVVISDDISLFEPGNLKQFDAVFFNNANNELFMPPDFKKLSEKKQAKALKRDAALKASLVDFIKSGKGVAVFHASLAIFREWDEWGGIIGGRFDNHPWNKEVTLRVENPSHPLNKAFGGPSITLTDEIYQVKGPYSRETHRVLLTLDLEKSGEPNVAELHREDKDFALAWIKPYGKGRVFYCGLGHMHELFWNPAILQFLLDGIQFAAGDLEADMTPSAKLSK